jgi:hypothetical protein
MTGVHDHAQLFCWDGISLTFWSWPQTAILLIFTSWSSWDCRCESLPSHCVLASKKHSFESSIFLPFYFEISFHAIQFSSFSYFVDLSKDIPIHAQYLWIILDLLSFSIIYMQDSIKSWFFSFPIKCSNRLMDWIRLDKKPGVIGGLCLVFVLCLVRLIWLC